MEIKSGMILKRTNSLLKYLILGFLFIIFIIYFGVFNKYHIHYLEQIQLFRFSLDYLQEHFYYPGGFANYIGNFFSQFFIYSWYGALIISLNGIAVFLITNHICKYYNLNTIISSIIPVWLLAFLQSNELFTFNQSIGFLLHLLYFVSYISIRKFRNRTVLFFIGWPVLYYLIGGFAIPAFLLCALHEVFYGIRKNILIVVCTYVLTVVLIPYIFARFLFYIPYDKLYYSPICLDIRFNSVISFFALVFLLSWNPLLLLYSVIKKMLVIKNSLFVSNVTSAFVTMFIMFIMGFLLFKHGYNRRAEIMLGMDHHVQNNNWEKVLELSDSYPDLNNLVIYYTNLALYKSGCLSDKLFHYPQIGSKGLRLKWARDINLFFGGEVFYNLSYTNEAYHWAFESMIANGLNPRSLKRLVQTSIIYRDIAIAKKYLNLLEQTLFYRSWAQFYLEIVRDPALAETDPEISHYRRLMIEKDFFSDPTSLSLYNLLHNNPENKMAYEYLMASFLLDKNLDEFVNYIIRLREYGYNEIPIHYEEALLFYNSYNRKNLIPEGFEFRAETINRLLNYATDFNASKSNMKEAAKKLKSKYGNTYWYYLHFTNNK